MAALAGAGEAIASMTASMNAGIAMSNAATEMQMKMSETNTKNDLKKQAVKMLADAAKPPQ
ncbi:hypothetical protein [Burkholderia ubonensis]|uniref:Uncharacterized protein n=1 Tax=Burkholderia ubonensis subsp. mesacidophila TaxID=265293 RepID=A0A2A4FJ89_9BURK|nr:hypothetical protein [Burkholderia ubonensis]PCE32399.1 hypothetical protein BZL54_11100 [Burkholderia ubonensis subsp. mesacidophila]